jgi:hypothetical protein
MFHGIPLSDLFPNTRIFNDCWEGRDGFRALVPRHFKDPAAYTEQRRLLDARHFERGILSAVLGEQNEGFGAGAAALRNVARLSEQDAVAVIG